MLSPVTHVSYLKKDFELLQIGFALYFTFRTIRAVRLSPRM